MTPDEMLGEHVKPSINGMIQAVIKLYLDLKNDPEFGGKQSAIVKEITGRLEIDESAALQALELHQENQEGPDRPVTAADGSL